MSGSKKVISNSQDSHEIIFDYKPKQFPLVITKQASGFISGQKEKVSDFKISDLVAEQVGIRKLAKDSIDEQVEKQALEKLKEVEERAYQEAYELGMLEGTAQAFEENKQDFIGRLKAMDDFLASLEGLKTRLFKENESLLMKVAFHIAERMTMAQIDSDPSVILKVITHVIEEAQTEEKILIKISNLDLMFIESLREKTELKESYWDKVRFEGTDDIQPGGCVVETEFGSIDASVQERVERAWKAIAKRIPKITSEETEQNASQEGSTSSIDQKVQAAKEGRKDDNSGNEDSNE